MRKNEMKGIMAKAPRQRWNICNSTGCMGCRLSLHLYGNEFVFPFFPKAENTKGWEKMKESEKKVNKWTNSKIFWFLTELLEGWDHCCFFSACMAKINLCVYDRLIYEPDALGFIALVVKLFVYYWQCISPGCECHPSVQTLQMGLLWSRGPCFLPGN